MSDFDHHLPPSSTDTILTQPRQALELADGDQVVAAILVVEYIPMDGEHAGKNVLAWTVAEELPTHRAIGMLDVVRYRQFSQYDYPDDD